MKMLDAGAYGIICPMIETAEQAERFVSHCFYPPDGNRSFGPTRAMIHGGSDYPAHSADNILPIVMIETRKALDNLDDILSTSGLGGVYIGPFDLSYALGCTPQADNFEDEIMAAIDHILARARYYNVPAAIHGIGHQFADQMRTKGFNMVTAGCDAEFIRAGASAIINALKPS
ncbi:HpcH/HpaI aldolase family protein [Endozoicomonas ascidiicola]|uniref:HpcH/HpaI aldolase family protein n=1 Tax=Endozoicomonas ascidiicola TaxID=1698521 RepID=UPI000AF743CC|nr:aldolase/citrate lyase family protein [Endozoicomonas ascidiicola]